jgi:hypothetical protein
MMREGYVTAYLPGEPQCGHRVAYREGRTGPEARHDSDLPMRACASARELLVNIDPRTCYASNITWAVDNRLGKGPREK